MTVYMNLSTAIAWRRHPVGVLRVERELARELKKLRTDIQYVRFDSKSNRFNILDESYVNEVLDDRWCYKHTRGSTNNDFDSDSASICSPQLPASSKFKAGIKKIMPAKVWIWLRKTKCWYYGWEYKKIYTHDTIKDPQTNSNLARHNSQHELNLIETRDVRELSLEKKDVFVSVGADWDHTPIQYIFDLKSRYGCKVVLSCYDLIPILFPEHTVRIELADFFKKHFVDMGHTADAIFAISDKTKDDLSHFYSKSRICRPLPIIESIPLAGMNKKQIDVLDSFDNKTWNELRRSGQFVLYVSTIESRKNHKILFDVWSELTNELEEIPTLIFVGMQGWGVNDLLDQIKRSNAFKLGKLRILTDISDDLLGKMYETCLFGVFPSLYEGWGLAATELMSYNKICVCSNNSALGQATQHLVPLIHPLDYISWKKEIKKLITDKEYRLLIENKIRKEFKVRSWSEFSDDFNRLLEGVAVNV